MEKITLQELVKAVGGDLLQGDPAQEVTGICTDTRKVKPGDAFFALVAERDGHAYIGAALQGGAAGCVVSKVPENRSPVPFYILVPDTMKALGDLARWYRRRFSIPVVGVTGSVGKTTTKDTIAAVLGARYKTLKTQGNFNNHLGVPLTILGLDKTHEAAVVEMGMNHPGEISYLTGIVRPTMAVITNIGDAHLENLGSRENTLRAKCEIFEGMPEGAPAVFSGDDALLTHPVEDVAVKIAAGRHPVRYVGTEQARLPSQQLELHTTAIRDRLADRVECDALDVDGNVTTLSIPALGRHMVYPMMMAAETGRLLGLTTEEIRKGLQDFAPSPMRMQVIHPGGTGKDITLINDAYNANPQSMKNALQILSNIERTESMRKIAVLGDMLELGTTEEALHRGVGAAAADLDIDVLIAVGPRGRWIAEGAEEALAGGSTQVFYYPEKEDSKETLQQILNDAAAEKQAAVLLFKGSRGMKMEELCRFCELTTAER